MSVTETLSNVASAVSSLSLRGDNEPNTSNAPAGVFDSDHSINREYKYLTKEDVDHFLEHGWLRVPNAIKPEYLKWVDDLWTRIGYDPNDKSTWHTEYLHLPRHHEVPAEEFAPDAWNKTIELCGGIEKIHPTRERYYGDAFIVNFGSDDKSIDEVYRPQDKSGWHTDVDWYRLFLDSSGNAMTVIHCFTDIPKKGGGTWLCNEGMKETLEYLYTRPDGIDPPVDGIQCQHIPSCTEFDQVEAKKGDVFLLHGLLPHVVSPNQLRYARVISNPHVSLAAPHNLNRPDGKYNLLEQKILKELGRDSIPEWKLTRERKHWYPRNAGFKRAYAEEELARMETAAEAKGLPKSSVDSIYQKKGTKEWDEYEIRNGFREPVGGLLMEQHVFGKFK